MLINNPIVVETIGLFIFADNKRHILNWVQNDRGVSACSGRIY